MPVRAADAGFVDLQRLVANHPLHGILAQYDRDIAALRATQQVAGLRDPALSAADAVTSLRADTASAASRADAIGKRDGSADLARERQSITAVLRSQRAADRAMAVSRSQLVTETNANLHAFSGAIARRTERAYAARQQQLRENESTLAYQLERRDAGKRLMLRLKLDDLHASPAQRARLQTALTALDASERQPLDALRRADANDLAVYQSQLQRDASAGAGAMDSQLRVKSAANYAVFQRVFSEAGATAGTLPSPSQLAALRTTYAPSRSAQSIASGMRSASDDVAQRFEAAAAVDADSQRDVAAQLRSLRAARAALYRTIVAQIRATAQLVARQRHVRAVTFVNGRSQRGVDLTAAVASRLSYERRARP